jgi:hypothetical protein
MALAPEQRELPGNRMHAAHLGSVTGKPPNRMLAVDSVDKGAQIRVAKAGTVGTLQFDDDEGPGQPTYVMFLERNIVGLVRLGSGPRAQEVATYLGVVAARDLYLTAIESPDVTARLNRPAGEFKQVKVSTVRGRGSQLSAAGFKLGKAFEAVEEVVPGVEEITLTFGVREAKKRAGWWERNRSQFETLAGTPDLLDQFDEAKITYTQGVADLLADWITGTGKVPQDEHKHVSDWAVATAITTAFRENRTRLLAILGGDL